MWLCWTFLTSCNLTSLLMFNFYWTRAKFIVGPLEHIFNLSLSTGLVPKLLKTSKIIPVFKNGDKSLFTNYRPISLLPQFSKIVEKLFAKRLNAFISKNKIINDNQYGFQPKRSVNDAISDTIKFIQTLSTKNISQQAYS